jgi:hypothetical protein
MSMRMPSVQCMLCQMLIKRGAQPEDRTFVVAHDQGRLRVCRVLLAAEPQLADALGKRLVNAAAAGDKRMLVELLDTGFMTNEYKAAAEEELLMKKRHIEDMLAQLHNRC